MLVAYQYLDRQQMTLNRIAYFEAINENTYYLRDMDFKSLSDEMLRGYRPYLTSGDVNGDGAEDLLIGMSDGSYYLIINGSARGEPFTVQQVQEDWAGLRLRSGATPELFDVDGDGDLDVVAGMDNGWIGLWINTGNAQTAKFNADLSANPNINMLGNVRTVGSQSLLGRSAPRLVVNQSDTILLTGSHEGQLYAYHFEWSKRTSSFLPVETDQWPEWVGGNGRLAIQALDNHKFRFLAGNIAGGLIEREVNVLSTHSTREDGVINKIQVFPNPIRNGELLRIHADRHRILDKIVVRSVSGLPWKTLNVSSIVTEISTLGLHPGIYFVELNYRALHREVKKLVVY